MSARCDAFVPQCTLSEGCDERTLEWDFNLASSLHYLHCYGCVVRFNFAGLPVDDSVITGVMGRVVLRNVTT